VRHNPLSASDEALRAAARRQREAREAPAARAAEEARAARRAREADASAADRAAVAARAEAGVAAFTASRRRLRQHQEAAGLTWLLPDRPAEPEEAAHRARLAQVSQACTGLRTWTFGGLAPAAVAPAPAAHSAVGFFLHAGVAVTVTPSAAGRPSLPLPPRARAPGVADRPDGDLI
jgi:hypothetical protein